MENGKRCMRSSYEITWIGMDGSYHEENVIDNNIYEYANMLEEHGAHSIAIYHNGEEIDRYLQGRSTRNLSSI